MCRRHFGIDTCGILEVKNHQDYAFQFIFHTPSGHIGRMSGNGCICFVTYLKTSSVYGKSDDVTFLAGDGVHYGNYDPSTREGWTSMVDITQSNVTQVSKTEFFINTGVPHLVIFTDNDVRGVGNLETRGESLSEEWREFETESSHVKVLFAYEEEGILHCRSYDKDLGREPVACGTGTAAIGIFLNFTNTSF